MADNFQIPTFREKVITWNGASGTTYSFIVASSYKGILRLSPNDGNSLVEASGFNIDSLEYRDSLEPAITKQLIRVSTSDGYLVGLRINQTDIETDNLFVIGKAHHDLIRLYTTKDNAFRISEETCLPVMPNTDPAALVKSEEFIDQDITEIDVHNATEKSFLVISSNEKERIFDWNQTAQIVKDYVRDAMLDLQTLPTGSIHFCPISIEQYQQLLLGYNDTMRAGIPNEFFTKDGIHPNDSIIRDFLVCDGSLYKNDDYPELAKVLEGERIDYWRYDKSKNKMVKATEYYNDYTEHKWFRVPDLRCRFLKSVMCSRDDIDLPGNQTGSFTNDSLPESSQVESGSHTHFITTAFYQNEPNANYEAVNSNIHPPNPPNIAFTFQNYAHVAEEAVEGGFDTTKRDIDSIKKLKNPKQDSTGALTAAFPGVMAPHNLNQIKWPMYYGMNYRRKAGGDCDWQWCADHSSAYFLSIPRDYNLKTRNYEANVGATSIDLIACDEDPRTEKDFDYDGSTDYVPFVNEDGSVNSSYGMEVLPEHYMALPLIKI